MPFRVEDKPDDFVERPEEFNQLLALLLNPKREEPIAITAALRGAGGYGKTTLAKALCHDEAIQNAFDDGILWVTLGENPGNLNRSRRRFDLHAQGRTASIFQRAGCGGSTRGAAD